MANFRPDDRFMRGVASNPANPSGLTQTATRLGDRWAEFRTGQGALQPWMPESSMLETASSWYTGANSQGTTNGWDTPFYQEAFRQRDEYLTRAAQEQRPSMFFNWLDPSQNRSATGVATWDDPNKGIRFGDVYENGVKRANLYDTHDEATADVMMGEFMLPNDEKARLFRDPQRQVRYRERIEQERARNSEQAQYAKSAEDFHQDVQQRQEDLQDSGASLIGGIAGGAGGGAATGAGIGAMLGSILPGLGTAVGAGAGALIGTAVGAVGGWLNQDQLSEIAARAAEVTERANQAELSWTARTGNVLKEYSGLAMRTLNPTSNIVQGLYDVKAGGLGDGAEEFYAYDEKGNRKASGWWQAADLAATIADGALQFSSVFGKWAYMGTMLAGAGGGALALTSGSGFNDSRGDFDKYETGGEWLGAIGSNSIDWVQLGVAGMLSSAARSSRAAAGLETGAGESGLSKLVTGTGDKVLGRGKMVGDHFETVNGIRFGLDAQGKVLSSRVTMEFLAPSEFMRWIPTGWRARRFRDLDTGMVSRDDLYNAALEMTTNGSRFTDALVNGYAEGAEEVFQAILDPLQFGDTATFEQITQAALYGAAGGFGMSLGSANQRASDAQVMERRAWVNTMLRGGAPDFKSTEWKDTWKRATPAQRKAMAVQSPKEVEQTRAMLDTMAEMHQHDAALSSTVGLAAGQSMKLSRFQQLQKRALQEGNGSLALMGRNNNRLVAPDGTMDNEEFAANSAVMTAFEVINQLENNFKGVGAQLEKAREQLDQANQALRQTTDPTEQARLQERANRIADKVTDLTVQERVSRQISDKFAQLYEQFFNEQDLAKMERLAQDINVKLRDAYQGSWRDNNGTLLPPEVQGHVRRAVEMKLARHPYQDQGSWALLVPQMSMQLTRLNAHSTVYVDQATLKTMGADHDGDTAVAQWDVYLSQDATAALRRGVQYVKDVFDADGQRMGVEIKADEPDGEQAFLNAFAAAYSENPWHSPERIAIQRNIDSLVTDFRSRYSEAFGGPLDDGMMVQLLDRFARGIQSGEPKIRMELVNSLWNLDTEALLLLGESQSMQEALWMLGRINQMYDNLQKELATLEATNQKQVLISEANRPAAETSYQTRKARLNAADAATSLSMLGATDATRSSQYLHYSALYRALAQVPGYEEGGFISGQQFSLTELYANIAGATQSDTEQIAGRNAIEQRVVKWLEGIANSVEGGKPRKELMLLLAMTRVPSIEVVDNVYSIGTGDISLLQLLLRRSLQIEENIQRDAPQDADIRSKIAKLKTLTKRDAEGHSVTASKALLEVFGDHKIYDLVGDDSLYISPHMTLNQVLLQLQGMSNEDRNQALANLQRTAPYFQKHGLGDPPYATNVLIDAENVGINAFTMLVDAVRAGAQTNFKVMKDRDDRVSQKFRDGLGNLHEMMDHHRQLHGVRLSSELSDAQLLEDMLLYRPDVATMIAEKLIPEAAQLGVFSVQENGKVHVAKWLLEMLTTRDVHRAEVLYFVHTKLAEWNVLGGTVDLDRVSELEKGAGLEQVDQVVGKVRQGRIKSRFLQTLFQVASQPDGVQLTLFLRAMKDAPTLEDLMTQVNENSAWLGSRERLLPYHDDVALFEIDPRDVWNPSTPSSIQRENLTGWGDRMATMNSIMREERTNFEQNERTILLMLDHVKHGTDIDNAKEHYSLLRKAIANRQRYPDAIGPVARDQISQALQGMLLRLHDKGKADEMARGFGEGMVTSNSWGYADGLRQELNALTAHDFEDIRTNLTKLVEGPVRIQLSDGSMMRIDMSDPQQALEMLADPRTQAFAMAVLFPTVRDVNSQNVVQTYSDNQSQGSISKMLYEQNYVGLFADAEGLERYERDLRYIGTLEAGIRRKIQGREEEAEEMFAPIQHMINEWLVAASHRPGYETQNLDMIRRQVISDVADAIRAVAALDPSNLPDLRRAIDARLQKHFWNDSTALEDFLQTDIEREFIEFSLGQMVDEYYDKLFDAKEAQIAQARAQVPVDTTEVTRLESELAVLWAEFDTLANDKKLKLPSSAQKSVQAVLNLFTLSGDPVTDPHRKMAIISSLGKQNRLNRYRTKDEIELYHKARRMIYLDRLNLLTDNDPLTPEEWNKLGSWAAASHISELTSRSSSEVSLAALDTKDPNLVRYFDSSWSFLADGLFDPNVLEEARFLAGVTRANRYDLANAGGRTIDEVSKELDDKLLNVRNLGTWSDRVPVMMQRARKVTNSAPVGAAIQTEGNDPKEMADYLASSRVTWEKPLDEHFTVYTLPGTAGQGITDLLSTNWHGFLKLQNHFVRTLQITYDDPANPGQKITRNLMDSVGLVNMTNESIQNSGLRVLELSRLQDAIESLQQQGMTDYLLDIEFVDVDKLPSNRTPDDIRWANNIYFDGVGREARGGSGVSAIAGLFFGLDGLSKVGQQNPLDMATKKGKGFRAWFVSKLEVAEGMEAQAGRPIAEILSDKALHLLKQKYPTGELLPVDLPSLYKLVKMRHVIVGKNSSGKKEVWWPDDVIYLETQGKQVPLSEMQLVPISDSVAQTLLGGMGQMGVRGSLTRPALNLSEMDAKPSLDEARLRYLGLTRIGETTRPGNSDLTTVTLPPRATMSLVKGAEARKSHFLQRAQKWYTQRDETILHRTMKVREGGHTFDMARINSDNTRALNSMLLPEAIAQMLHRNGIPFADMEDMTSIKVSDSLARKLKGKMTGNNVIWVHKQDQQSSYEKGHLGPADIKNNFSGLGGIGPTLGDVVVLDLSSMLRAAGSYREALKQASGIIEAYADRGVTIALTSERGEQELRNALRERLQMGGIGYRPVADSAHFFEPILRGDEESRNLKALESTLLEVEQFTRRGIALGIVADGVGTWLSEGTQGVDVRYDTNFTRVSHALIPTTITSTGDTRGEHNRLAFNTPVRGTGNADQYEKMCKALIPLLSTQEGRKHLAALSSGYSGDKSGNPKKVRLRRRNKDNGLTEPGVLPMEDALNELLDTLNAGKYPLDIGTRVSRGTIIPLVAGDGSIYLSRMGFEIPDMKRMGEMLKAPLGENAAVDGKRGLKIAVAPNSLNRLQTVPPPFIVDEVVIDHRGLSVRGTHELNSMAKIVSEGMGLKTGLVPMPDWLQFPDAVLRRGNGKGVRVTRVVSETSTVGKEATKGFTDNFRDMFALTGANFMPDVLDVFFGKNRDPRDEAQQWEDVSVILKAWANADKMFSARDIARALDAEAYVESFQNEINILGAQIQGSTWRPLDLSSPQGSVDPQRQLVQIMLAVLAAPGVRLEHVISTPGLIGVTEDSSLITKMPALFTDALCDPAYPELRNMLIGRANDVLPKQMNAAGELENIYWFDEALTFHARMQDGQGKEHILKGTLQMSMPIPADENAVSLQEAALVAGSTPASQHIAQTTGGAINGEVTVQTRKKTKDGTLVPDLLDEFFGDNKVLRFEDGDGAALWEMLTRVDVQDYSPWSRTMPMEMEHYKAANAKLRQYTVRIPKTEADGWSEEQKRTADKWADRLLERLNLKAYGPQERVEVDYLVRQFWGRPGPARDQTDYTSDITSKVYTAAVDLMLENLDKGLHPLHGAQVPLEHMAFWHKVYKAQLQVTPRDRWLPLKRDGKVKEPVSMEWADWVNTLHGQFRTSKSPFHSMHRTALDGFYHTYQGSTLDFQTLPLSTDDKINAKLMDKDTNRLFMSIDPGEDALLRDPVILDTMKVSYEALVGEDPMYSQDGRTAEASPLQEQIARQTAWLRENKIAKQKQQSVTDYAREGVHYQESVRKTNVLSRSMVNLSITTRLFNPALYVSAYIEVPFRNMFEHATNLLTGSHLGPGGGVLSKIGASKEKEGISTRFTNEEVDMVNALAKSLGESNRFLGELFGEMTYQSVTGGGPDKRPWFDRMLERSATAVSKGMSDPRWGMRNTSVAKRYLEGAIEQLVMTDSVITVEQLVQLLEKDPLWLKKHGGEGFSAHRAGTNRVAQVRSTRPTVASTVLMSPIDRWTSSESAGVNLAGHLLKIPFMFTRFNMNTLMTMTGLNTIDQVAAMFFDQRRQPEILKRIGSLGRADKYDYAGAERMDLSTVIQSVDLSRAFVQGALTQTSLMALGMIAGNLGLGGEDEEARRRRKLAELLNVPNYRNPLEAYNDFRWTDAIFLDEIPVLDNLFKDETKHSAVVPHWVTRQFLSPVMGMVRFFETGDFKEIGYGFWDAAAAIPNSVVGLWREADLTANLLAEAASDLEGIPEKEEQVSQLLINAVGIYEKALIENSFVNALRVAGDEFDRNPWIVPMTADENTGELDRLQGSNLPQPTDALVQYQTDGENPENRAAYMTRSGTSALMHQYAENNATAAFLMSLITGQFTNSSFARKNMAVRQREVQLSETPKAQAEALILASYLSQGGGEKLTKSEIVNILKAQAQAANVWWNQADLEAKADQIYAAESQEGYELSIIDPEGRELLGKDGAAGVFKSVKDGILKPGDAALAGISIPYEMRVEIAKEWMAELIQEGMDLGLTEEGAKYRADRFWWGDKNNPGSPSLRALIFDKRIPTKAVATYDQLNVTYVIGPDGRPWATPFQRQSVIQALGIPLPHRVVRPKNGTTLDERGNVVDLVKGVNTGLAGIVPTQLDEAIVPNDNAAKEALAKTYTPSSTYSRRPWTKFPKRKYTPFPARKYSGSSGYGGGSSYGPPFQRMTPLPTGTAVRFESISMINTNSPYIRRANVHRERITSERGRLKQWQ